MRILFSLPLLIMACAHGGDRTAQPPGTAKTETVAERVAPAPTEAEVEAIGMADIKKQLNRSMPAIQSCYEGFLKPEYHPSVEMVVVLLADKEGIVHGLRVEKIEPDIPGLVACFTPQLIKVRLPPSDEPQELAFPVSLSPTADAGPGASENIMEAPPNQGPPEGAPAEPVN